MNNTTLTLLTVLLVVFLSSCKKTQTYTLLSMEDVMLYGSELPESDPNTRLACSAWENYVPYPENMLWFEQEKIRINFHTMYDSVGDKLMPFKEKRMFLWYMMDNAHLRLRSNPKMNLPVGNNTPNLQPMYMYEITASPDTNNFNGHYAHVDDELYFYLNKGKHRNNYSKEVIKKYAIHDDTILNVFVMPVHPDSVASKTYKQHNAGVALGTSVKISGFWEDDPKPWEYAAMFNHEVGHVFGLAHAWTKSDGCEDTPVNPNCFQKTNKEPCKGPISNNLMDYNNEQMAITPCQLGIIHRTMHDIKSKKRKLVKQRWCKYNPNPIIITDIQEWNGNKDLSKDIIVKGGASLSLSCRISMAKGAKIIVEEGGKLVLDNVRLHNDCGDTWGGIKIHSRNPNQSIIFRGTNVIENTGTQLSKV